MLLNYTLRLKYKPDPSYVRRPLSYVLRPPSLGRGPNDCRVDGHWPET